MNLTVEEFRQQVQEAAGRGGGALRVTPSSWWVRTRRTAPPVRTSPRRCSGGAATTRGRQASGAMAASGCASFHAFGMSSASS
jgi:hypothetical protein